METHKEQTINFKEKYGNLINANIPKHQLKSFEEQLDSDTKPFLPEEHQKKWITHPEGFVARFCEEY